MIIQSYKHVLHARSYSGHLRLWRRSLQVVLLILMLAASSGAAAASHPIPSAATVAASTSTIYQDSFGNEIRNVASGKCLDVEGGHLYDHANIQQFSCFGGTGVSHQAWFLDNPTVGSYTAIRVRGENMLFCLDVPGGNPGDGVKIQLFTCNGGANQQWLIQPVGSGAYRLVSLSSGKCLEVANASSSNNVDIQQSTCRMYYGIRPWLYQRWRFYRLGV
jgi:hypothetical protein